MTTLSHNSYWQQCCAQPFHTKWALFTAVVFGFAVFNYIALANVSMLLLLVFLAPQSLGLDGSKTETT